LSKKVLIAFPEKYLKGLDTSPLQGMAEAEFFTSENRNEFLERIKDADVLIPGTFPTDENVINAGKKLKMIQTFSVGYEDINVKVATEKGIIVCNNAEVNAESVAELTWALILGLARQIAGEDRLMRTGGWGRFMGEKHTILWEKTLGIIGFGAIGQRVALTGRLAFNMRILAYDPFVLPERVEMFGGKLVDLETLLKESDVVSIHCPLTEKTRHMIGEKELNSLKKSAFLINTARGAIIDEKALIKHLQEDKIWGAGLDVYEEEPLSVDSPLRKLENVILVPHIGTAPEALIKMFKAGVENVARFLRGETPLRVVNPTTVLKG